MMAVKVAAHQCIKVLSYFVLLSHLVNGQNWLIDELLPAKYDPMEAPIEEINELLHVNATIQLKSYQADSGQRVSQMLYFTN